MCSGGFDEVGEHNFEAVKWFVVVAHHTQVVGSPDSCEVHETISTHPLPVVCHVIVVEQVHVIDLPLEALLVAVVPGAVTTTLLWPQVHHLSSEIEWVSHNTGNTERDDHVDKLAPVI